MALSMIGSDRDSGVQSGQQDAPAETADIETSSAEYAGRFSGAGGRYLLDVQARTIAEVLSDCKPGIALDVGGGHGQLVDLLRSLGWTIIIFGSDPQCGRNLRELHGKRDCEFVSGDLLDLPFPDGSFDLVTAVRLVPHVTAWERLLAEMCRVARRWVLVDYPSKRALNALTPLFFGLKKSIEGNTRTYTSFSRSELARQFDACGFAVTTERKQFFLPMVVHRLARGARLLRGFEGFFRASGLTSLAGSPVILRADRRMADDAARMA